MPLSTHTVLRAASVALLLAGGFTLTIWMTPPGAAQSYNGPSSGSSGGAPGRGRGDGFPRRGGPGGRGGQASTPPGGAGQPPQRRPESRILSFAADDRRRVWLREEGEEVVLSLHEAGRTSEVGRGKGWAEVALSGDRIFVLSRHGSEGTVLQWPTGKGTPTVLRDRLSHPAGLRADDAFLYWTETLPPKSNTLLFVPGGGPTLHVMAQPIGAGASSAARLAEWPGSLPSGVPGSDTTNEQVDRTEILDVDGESLLIRLGRPLTTEFLVVPRQGGGVRRIASESGRQDAARADGRYYWTAPSLEATPNASMVRICASRGGDAPVETVGEWLPQGGRLIAKGGPLRYASDYLYQIPTPMAYPKRLQRLTVSDAAFVGNQVVLLGEGGVPMPMESRP